ncbi:alpha/beta fold hydrolase [Herbidospora yilanensis]|uniref:alpha/beta fold hydrolase n=1 Tax=Herbidospora yilanensis TaxID=354426 RepID=UPI000780E9A9|nr:alpha/beta hydrolase [Herbidospora yilanensis]
MTGGEGAVAVTNGGRTSCRIDGAGPPVVLVHGLQIGQSLFDAFRRHLTDTFTVVTYDQRDRGASVFAPEPYTIDDLADDLAALISALGFGRAHVLGTSYGGMIAQAFALRHANRLDRLVLGSTNRFPFDPDRLPDGVRALLGALEAGDHARARDLLARLAPAAARSGDPEEETPESASERLVRRFAAARGFDTRGLLGSVASPTLVVHGRRDATIRVADVLAMAEEIPGAGVLQLADAGHAWENERPASAAALIAAFLTGSD